MRLRSFLLGFFIVLILFLLFLAFDLFMLGKQCPSDNKQIICEILKNKPKNFEEAKELRWSCCKDALNLFCRNENLESLGVNESDYETMIEFCSLMV